MNTTAVLIIAIIGAVAFIWAIHAAFLCLACWICRARPVPGFGRSMRIIVVDFVVHFALVVGAGCFLALLAFKGGSRNVQGSHAQIASMTMQFQWIILLVSVLVSTLVYSWMIPTGLGRGLLVELVKLALPVAFVLVTLPLLPSNLHQVMMKRITESSGEKATRCRSALQQIREQLKTGTLFVTNATSQILAAAPQEASTPGGTPVASNSKWRLLEVREIGNVLTRAGMPDKATAGKFVLVACQEATRDISSRRVVYSPVLVDSQGRQFNPMDGSVSYLPEGVRFMTVEPLPSGAIKTFRSIYEVAADSVGLHIPGESPAEGAEKKNTP